MSAYPTQRGPSLIPITPQDQIASLLSERSRNSPIPPPSPIFTHEGEETSPFSSPKMSQMSFDLARTQYLDDDEDRFADSNSHSSNILAGLTGAPGSPNSFIDFGGSDFGSPVPSIASVRVAQKVARPPASASRLAHVATPTDEHSTDNWETTTSPGRTQPLNLSRAKLGPALSVSPPSRAPPSVPALVEPNAQEAIQQGNESLGESDNSWREGLDAIVDRLDSSQSSGLKVDAGPEARFNSILGPKMKIISPAPWDAESDDIFPEPAPVAVAPVVSRKSTDTTRGQSMSAPKGDKETKQARSRTRSFSVLSSRRAGPSSEEVEERDEAFKGLGLGFSQSGTHKAPGDSPSKSRSLKNGQLTISPPVLQSSSRLSAPNQASPTATRSNSLNKGQTNTANVLGLAANRDSGSRSAPAHMTAFNAMDLMPRSESGASLALNIPPVPTHFSTSSPTTPTGLPLSSPTSPFDLASDPLASLPTASNGGPGFKLISLDEARQRETERIAAAAAHRKAMQPVENIAALPPTESSQRPSRTRESTTESNSTRASQIQITGSGAPSPGAARPPQLKNKKSGFLKRMMGDKADVPAMPVKESFRALPDDYLHQQQPAILTPTLEPSSPGASSGKVSFGVLPQPGEEGRMKIPALKLRPMSMAFSAGLPMDFLAEVGSPASSASNEDEIAPSSTSTISSSVFDSSSSAGTRTPLTPAFSSPPMSAAPMPMPVSAELATPEGYAALREQFARATSAWMKERHELERTIKELRSDLDKANKEKDKAQKLAQANLKSLSGAMSSEDLSALRESTAFGADQALSPPQVSVLERSRAVRPNAAGGAMFSGARA